MNYLIILVLVHDTLLDIFSDEELQRELYMSTANDHRDHIQSPNLSPSSHITAFPAFVLPANHSHYYRRSSISISPPHKFIP